MTSVDVAVVAAVRICLVAMFPLSTLEKIIDWRAALAQAGSSWLAGGPVLVVLAISPRRSLLCASYRAGMTVWPPVSWLAFAS
jgi:hypothetical protein